jgi:hypothetical protein
MPKEKAYILKKKFNLLNRMLIPLCCKDTNFRVAVEPQIINKSYKIKHFSHS